MERGERRQSGSSGRRCEKARLNNYKDSTRLEPQRIPRATCLMGSCRVYDVLGCTVSSCVARLQGHAPAVVYCYSCRSIFGVLACGYRVGALGRLRRQNVVAVAVSERRRLWRLWAISCARVGDLCFARVSHCTLDHWLTSIHSHEHCSC